MFTMNPTVLMKVLMSSPACMPFHGNFKFDRRRVVEKSEEDSAEREGASSSTLLRRRISNKVMHNIQTYSLNRLPTEDGLFMQWIAPLLQISIMEVDMY